MSFTYATFQKALAIEMAVPNNSVTDTQFVAILPTLIDQAEQRCYRELDLLYATSVQVLPAVANVRSFSLVNANPYIIAVERMRLYLPAGATAVNFTSAPPLTPISVDYLDAVFSGAPAGPPAQFGMQSDTIAVLGPTPDLAYNIEVSGEFRPQPLYSAPAGTTFLSTVLPDLFLAAAMVAAAGYQKNFGAQGDDPRQAMSWETQFQMALQSAKAEEMRKRFHGWQAMSSETNPPPTPMPQPGG